MIASQEERERIRVLDRLTAQRDATTLRREAETALARGELMGRIQAYEEVLKLPLTSRAELLGDSLKLLAGQVEHLRQQAGLAPAESDECSADGSPGQQEERLPPTVSEKERRYWRDFDRLVARRDAETLRQEALWAPVIGAIHACQKALKEELTPLEDLFPLSVEELSRQAEDLQRRLFARAGGAG